MSDADYTRSESPVRDTAVVIEEDDEASLGLAKFAAVVKPVAVTMAFASLLVVQVRTEAFSSEISQGLSVYTVYGDEPEDTGFDQFWIAILNSLAIVGGVLGMTVVMLCLFKFKCMKVLYGMLIFTTISSLSYTFGIIA